MLRRTWCARPRHGRQESLLLCRQIRLAWLKGSASSGIKTLGGRQRDPINEASLETRQRHAYRRQQKTQPGLATAPYQAVRDHVLGLLDHSPWSASAEQATLLGEEAELSPEGESSCGVHPPDSTAPASTRRASESRWRRETFASLSCNWASIAIVLRTMVDASGQAET